MLGLKLNHVSKRGPCKGRQMYIWDYLNFLFYLYITFITLAFVQLLVTEMNKLYKESSLVWYVNMYAYIAC